MSRDQRVESLLKRGNYRNAYQDKVLFSDIDFKASEENPARINRKINDDDVVKYGFAMMEGAVFPGIVLLKQDRAKHLVATGMHRCKAAIEVKRDWFDAYIVTEPDQFRCDLLIRLLNGIEGRGDTVKDQLRHVISLHEKYSKHSLNELALAFNLSKGAVMNAWQAHKGIQRASRLGFDFEGSQKQPQMSIIALDQIVSDLVYVKAAEFIVHYEIPGREVEDLVRDLKNVRSKGESAEIQTITKWHDEADEKQRRAKSRIGKTSPTACTRFIGKCRGINKQMRKGIEHLHLSALGDVRDALTVVEDSIDNLEKVKAELERIERISGGSRSGLPMAAASV